MCLCKMQVFVELFSLDFPVFNGYGMSFRRTKALGRYCLKRLRCTCTVVILEQGEIIFDKKGRLGVDMTSNDLETFLHVHSKGWIACSCSVVWCHKLEYSGFCDWKYLHTHVCFSISGLDMIKVFRRSMRIGRNKKLGSGRLDAPDDTDKPPLVLQKSLSDLPNHQQSSISNGPTGEYDMSFGSCSSALQEDYSNSPVSVLPSERRNSTSGFEALRISFSKRRAQGTLKAAQLRLTNAEAEVERSDMFLLQHQGDAELTASAKTEDSSSPCSKDFEDAKDSDDAFVPGWPLLNNTIGFEKEKKKPAPRMLDRELSIVKWALQLPERGHDPSPSPKDFIKEETESKTRVRDPNLSLSQEVDRLCLDLPCTAFSYEDLEAATSGFSQGESNRISVVLNAHHDISQ